MATDLATSDMVALDHGNLAQAMGAQVVIAVNIGTPLLRKQDVSSLVSASDQLTRILTAANVAQSLKELGPADILLAPDLAGLASTDFDRGPEAAHASEAAARAAATRLAIHSIDAPDLRRPAGGLQRRCQPLRPAYRRGARGRRERGRPPGAQGKHGVARWPGL